MKTVEQLAIDNAKSKAFIEYGQKGFTCQIHYPELCKIIKEHDNEIIVELENHKEIIENITPKTDYYNGKIDMLNEIILLLKKEKL